MPKNKGLDACRTRCALDDTSTHFVVLVDADGISKCLCRPEPISTAKVRPPPSPPSLPPHAPPPTSLLVQDFASWKLRHAKTYATAAEEARAREAYLLSVDLVRAAHLQHAAGEP